MTHADRKTPRTGEATADDGRCDECAYDGDYVVDQCEECREFCALAVAMLSRKPGEVSS